MNPKGPFEVSGTVTFRVALAGGGGSARPPSLTFDVRRLADGVITLNFSIFAGLRVRSFLRSAAFAVH